MIKHQNYMFLIHRFPTSINMYLVNTVDQVYSMCYILEDLLKISLQKHLLVYQHLHDSNDHCSFFKFIFIIAALILHLVFKLILIADSFSAFMEFLKVLNIS